MSSVTSRQAGILLLLFLETFILFLLIRTLFWSGCSILLGKLELAFLKCEEQGRAPWGSFCFAAHGGASRARALLLLGESRQGAHCASVSSFLVEAAHATFPLIYNWSLGGKWITWLKTRLQRQSLKCCIYKLRNAKDYWEPSEPGRVAWTEFFLRTWRIDPGLQNSERINFVGLSQSFVSFGNLLWQPRWTIATNMNLLLK